MPEEQYQLRKDDLAWREFSGEAVLLDLRTSTYLAANPSATVLWHELEKGATETTLISALTSAFGVPHDRAAGDVSAFLADCQERGLLA